MCFNGDHRIMKPSRVFAQWVTPRVHNKYITKYIYIYVTEFWKITCMGAPEIIRFFYVCWVAIKGRTQF